MARLPRSRGQSIVEFALVLPVFLLLVVGIMDFGRGIASYSQLSNAARDGARTGIFTPIPDAEIRAAVRSNSAFLGALPDGDITITPAQGSRTENGTITVTAVYDFRPLTVLLGDAIGPSITMSASSTMSMEW